MVCSWKREVISPEWVTAGTLESFGAQFPEFVRTETRMREGETPGQYLMISFPPWPVFSFANLAETVQQAGLLQRTHFSYSRITTGTILLCASDVLEAVVLVGETALRMPFSDEVVSLGEGFDEKGGGHWSMYSLADWQFAALAGHSRVLQQTSKLSRTWFRRHGLRHELTGCIRDTPEPKGSTVGLWTPRFRDPRAGLELYKQFTREQFAGSKRMDCTDIVLSEEHVYASYTLPSGVMRAYTSRNSIVVLVAGQPIAT
jgi:hypothetical protein